jgi:Xaa-Pro aminopeptidase
LVVRPGSDAVLIVPRLERPRAEDSGAGRVAEIVDWPDGADPYATVQSVLPSTAGTVGVSDRLWSVHLLGVQRAVPDGLFGSAAPVISPLRAVKDAYEIELLQVVASAADRAFDRIAKEPFAGRAERDVAADLATLLVEEGHEMPLFTIVASGPNGASPHHEPGDRVIERGDAVVLDFGGRRLGYSSDITRTVFAGEPSEEMLRVYDAVRAGQRAAFERAAPGHRQRGPAGPGERVLDRARDLPPRPVRGPDRGHRRRHR